MKSLLLGESLEYLFDHRGKTPKKLGSDFVQEGVPVASAILVENGRLDLSGARYVDAETYRRWMPVPTRAGDVLLTSEAPLGRVARIPSDDPLVLGQRLYALRGRPGVLDNGYLYYALQTEQVRADLLGRSTGTTVFGIRQSALRHVLIPAPEYPEQRAIADVLGALDDKIAVNTRIASTAESIALLMISAAPPAVQLGDVVRYHTEQVNPSAISVNAVAHFSLPAYDAGQMPELTAPDKIKSGKFTVRVASVLMSKLNPRIPRVWNVSEPPKVPALASTEFLVLEPLVATSSVLWALLRQPSFGAALEGKVAGTSGSHQRVRPADLLQTPVPDPRQFSDATVKRVTSLCERAAQARSESRTLAAIRDSLLPALMSGKLRVRDAEGIVEEVA